MNDKLAKKDARCSVAPAYYSEHETGLCVDIAASDYLQLNRKQENTPENQWLRRHCAKYGFILRYPKRKKKSPVICMSHGFSLRRQKNSTGDHEPTPLFGRISGLAKQNR